MTPLAFVQERLAEGEWEIGQVRVVAPGKLGHVEGGAIREVFRNPHDAIAIARYDDNGAYRPLKTAPNLRHGWQLDLDSAADVLLALDFLYPAAIGLVVALGEGRLRPTCLRDTLARQTGMYAVVRNLTDAEAHDLIATTCNPSTGCLRRITWPISPSLPGPRTETPDGSITTPSLLCIEACNLLVAAGRTVVKSRPATGSS